MLHPGGTQVVLFLAARDTMGIEPPRRRVRLAPRIVIRRIEGWFCVKPVGSSEPEDLNSWLTSDTGRKALRVRTSRAKLRYLP